MTVQAVTSHGRCSPIALFLRCFGAGTAGSLPSCWLFLCVLAINGDDGTFRTALSLMAESMPRRLPTTHRCCLAEKKSQWHSLGDVAPSLNRGDGALAELDWLSYRLCCRNNAQPLQRPVSKYSPVSVASAVGASPPKIAMTSPALAALVGATDTPAGSFRADASVVC